MNSLYYILTVAVAVISILLGRASIKMGNSENGNLIVHTSNVDDPVLFLELNEDFDISALKHNSNITFKVKLPKDRAK